MQLDLLLTQPLRTDLVKRGTHNRSAMRSIRDGEPIMRRFKVVGLAAMLLTGMAVPLAAQQQNNGDVGSQMPNQLQPGGANVPDNMVQKAGAALRHVSQIQSDYSQRVRGANTQDERQRLVEEAKAAEVSAVANQGLSVDQYNQMLQLAQADPTFRQRLLSAAH
jgi:hypothetical protein